MATLAQIIQTENWTSGTFHKSPKLLALFSAGLISRDTAEAQAVMQGFHNGGAVMDTFPLLFSDYAFSEQNLGEVGGADATGINPTFTPVNVKSTYANQFFNQSNMQADLLKTSQPKKMIRDFIGNYFAEQHNHTMAAMLKGLSTLSTITVGTALVNFSNGLVIESRKTRGEKGATKLGRMLMNSTTLFDILAKQEASTITGNPIREVVNQVVNKVNGVQVLSQVDTGAYTYNNSTPVVVDDGLANGVITLVSKGAFVYAEANLENPLVVDENPKADNGAGTKSWGIRSNYVIHPLGFNFVGVRPTNYASKSGLSLAEMGAGGLFALSGTVADSPIHNIIVKIG